MQVLKGKTAIVTGSTSGIGLGIARALAGAGCDVMLNGFGDASAIEKERAGISKDFGVRAAFDPANLSKPLEIARMIDQQSNSLAGSTFWSITPASSTQRASRSFQLIDGTPSLPSICPRISMRYVRRCR